MNTRFFLTNSCPEAPGIVSQQPVPASLHRNGVWKLGKVKKEALSPDIVHFCIWPCLTSLSNPSSASTALEVREQPGSQTPLCDVGCAEGRFAFTNKDLQILSPPPFLNSKTLGIPILQLFFSLLRKLRTLSPSCKAFGALTGEATPGHRLDRGSVYKQCWCLYRNNFIQNTALLFREGS